MEKIINVGGRLHNPVVGGALTGADEIKDDTRGKMQNVINQETDAELVRLDEAKQEKLMFDQTPTEGSTNPVTSGGVYAADVALQQAIEAILLLIPSAASALNQLADKSFVNSSIATATATFRGTYNLVTDLELTVSATHQQIAAALASVVSRADNNDYCFVQIPVSDQSTDIRVTERYKFDGTSWEYEYDLNNSGFTADQWAAINSGITSVLVGKLGGLPTAQELATMFAGKQNTLTFDSTPVAGSDNPVKSSGLYNAFAAINALIPSGADANNKLVAESRLVAYVTTLINALDATFDVTSADGHVTLRMTQADGVITSVQILTSDIASASALTTLAGRVSTAESDIDALQDAYAALTQSDVVIVNGTLPSSGQLQNVIYRQPEQDHTPPQYYSDYMWNGTTWVLMATYMNAIDPRPKKGSQNLVTSGGVFDNMGALDVSELNATENPHTLATYADLSAALAAIPSDYQKGGMSIKFIQGTAQSSDNKYVQYRLMSVQWSTIKEDWTCIPTEYELYEKLDKKLGNNLVDPDKLFIGKAINGSGTIVSVSNEYAVTDYIPVEGRDIITNAFGHASSWSTYNVYDANFQLLRTGGTGQQYTYQAGDAFIRISFDNTPIRCANYGTTLIIEEYIDYLPLRELEIKMEEELDDKLDKSCSTNIIDTSKITEGKYFNSAGQMKNGSADYFITDYIRIKGENITMFKAETASVAKPWVAYDVNHNITHVGATPDTETAQYVYDSVNYPNDYYIRLALKDKSIAHANYGSTLLPYEPFTNYKPLQELKKELEDEINEVDEKKLDKVYGSNIIVPSTVDIGKYINGNGGISSGSATEFFVTDYIKLDGRDVSMTLTNYGSSSIRPWVAFDINHNITRVGDAVEGSGDGPAYYVFDSVNYPNDYYIRLGLKHLDKSHANFGSALLPYEPYTEYEPLTLLGMKVEEMEESVPTLIKEEELVYFPNYLYKVWNNIDVNRQVSLKMGLSRCLQLNAFSNSYKYFENGLRFIPVVPKQVSEVTEETVNVITDTKTLKVRNTPASISANIKPRVLVIGDSVTAGYGADSNKYELGLPNQYWAYAKMYFEMDKIDNSDTGHDILFVGGVVSDGSFIINYKSVSRQVTAKAEGKGGASLEELFNATWGENQSVNPFYDDVNHTFSIVSYLANYRTMDDLGVRLVSQSSDPHGESVVGSDGNTYTIGQRITTQALLGSIDVCTPTHVFVNLNSNTVQQNFQSNIGNVVNIIKTELPDVVFAWLVIDSTGTSFPKDYPDFDQDMIKLGYLHTKNNSYFNYFRDNLEDEENNIYLLGMNFIQPEAVDYPYTEIGTPNGLSDKYKIPNSSVSAGNYHPNNICHSQWGYELYSFIKWLISQD